MIKVSIEDLECVSERDKMSKREREREREVLLLFVAVWDCLQKKKIPNQKVFLKWLILFLPKGTEMRNFNKCKIFCSFGEQT